MLLAILLADVLHIMLQLPKTHDERENHHQLLIERNCSFAAIATFTLSYTEASQGGSSRMMMGVST